MEESKNQFQAYPLRYYFDKKHSREIFITTTKERIATMIGLSQDDFKKNPGLFWFTTQDQINLQELLNFLSVWPHPASLSRLHPSPFYWRGDFLPSSQGFSYFNFISCLFLWFLYNTGIKILIL